MRSQLQAHQSGSPGHPGPPAPACLPPEGQAQEHRIPPRPDTGNHQPFWGKLQHYDMAHLRREPRHRTEVKATPAGSGLLPCRLWPFSRPGGGQPTCHPHAAGRAHSSVFFLLKPLFCTVPELQRSRFLKEHVSAGSM